MGYFSHSGLKHRGRYTQSHAVHEKLKSCVCSLCGEEFDPRLADKVDYLDDLPVCPACFEQAKEES